MKRIVNTLLTAGLFTFASQAQTTLSAEAEISLTEKAETLDYQERSLIKQRAYEFLRTWNPSADLAKPIQEELSDKILKNKQKRKDPNKRTESLREDLEEAEQTDGTERSFIAESFAQPMLHELQHLGIDLPPSDIYTAQYVIKYTLGVPRFNHGELDVDNHQQMQTELTALISKYPDNDAHDQEVDGRVISIFREEANAYFEMFVAANAADLDRSQGNSGPINGLANMSCADKYKYLKDKGIMH
ncbi:hypothetical protein [Marinoscillum sp.]|uniref:hypothetical protein n=1 Tax=Marinoscillum sp. TaxID=2024838 RepID=UPI003BAA7029